MCVCVCVWEGGGRREIAGLPFVVAVGLPFAVAATTGESEW